MAMRVSLKTYLMEQSMDSVNIWRTRSLSSCLPCSSQTPSSQTHPHNYTTILLQSHPQCTIPFSFCHMTSKAPRPHAIHQDNENATLGLRSPYTVWARGKLRLPPDQRAFPARSTPNKLMTRPNERSATKASTWSCSGQSPARHHPRWPPGEN